MAFGLKINIDKKERSLSFLEDDIEAGKDSDTE